MTRKHQTSEYRRNARTVRAQVNAAHGRGEPWPCRRCGTAIRPGQPFDIGHHTGAQGSSLAELGAEHRHRTTHCIGNRSAGGREGATITNARRSTSTSKVSTWPV